jgi:feruloyl esterase
MKSLAAFTCVVLFGAALHGQSGPVAAAQCDRLAASLTLPGTRVTAAQAVTGGRFEAPPAAGAANAPAPLTDLPAFCRVQLVLTPSADSDIRSEVWLPLNGWNGKFQQVGNGGWGGSIQYAALATALRRGYAAASTDTGHVGDTARFAVGHPEKLIDFGHRAVHETAVRSKAAIAALYGSAPRFSYFNGCSGGGRQGFMEAQRHPEDFDAIIAGAPGYNRTDQSFQLVLASQATHRDAASFIPPAKLTALHKAAIAACDARDGAADGLISDPLTCRFDPQVVACKAGDRDDCLTAPQMQAARRIYAPIVDPRTGRDVFPGVEAGSEPRWTINAGGARPLGMSDELFKFVVFKDPNWDFLTLDVARHLDLARAEAAKTLDATSADLKPFVGRGGKLLIYHGWGDTNVPPRSSVHYYDRLVETLGAREVANSVRLYMVPGMGHCGGGEGPNLFDALAAMENWREKGVPPTEFIASQVVDGRTVRTRPLCPYPQVPRYRGSGSLDQAASFACRP